jgi:hypothetical protein
MEMLLKDKNAIAGTFVNVTSGTLPSYITPASMTTQRQRKAA